MSSAVPKLLALPLFVLLLGCREPAPPRPTPLEVELGAPRLGARGQSTTVELDLQFKNATASPEEMFVFVTAHNHQPRPPTRVIWPPAAEPELRNSYTGLIVGVPTRGFRVQLAPGASTSTSCRLLTEPNRRALEELWIQGYDAQGGLVFDRRESLR